MSQYLTKPLYLSNNTLANLTKQSIISLLRQPPKDVYKRQVLSGGGSKGAYEAGFLLAAKELNQHFDIVTGTSIGALNGALAVSYTHLVL